MELALVIAVLSILGFLGVQNIDTARIRSYQMEAVYFGRLLATTQESYRASNGGYADTAHELGIGFLPAGHDRYLTSEFGRYEYIHSNGIVGSHAYHFQLLAREIFPGCLPVVTGGGSRLRVDTWYVTSLDGKPYNLIDCATGVYTPPPPEAPPI